MTTAGFRLEVAALDVAEVLLDQREANQRLVLAMLRAHEFQEEAEAARAAAVAATAKAEAALRLAEKTARELAERDHELRATAEVREKLLAILGHDLRNPLGAMIMSASLLVRRANFDGSDTTLLQLVVRSGDRMMRMIDQLLDFTRARLGGGLALDWGLVDLAQVLPQIIAELQIASTIELRCRVGGDLAGNWDADRLSAVFSNIAGNAIEHASPGTVIEVRGWEEGALVVIEISNQGPPIPPELLPFIFDPFRRGRGTQRKVLKSNNLGLGLYIAHEIVLAHGGTLEARCEGGITTFTMRLPRDPV